MFAATALSSACPDGELEAAVAPLLSPPRPLQNMHSWPRTAVGMGQALAVVPTSTLQVVAPPLPLGPVGGRGGAVRALFPGPRTSPAPLFVMQSWAWLSGDLLTLNILSLSDPLAMGAGMAVSQPCEPGWGSSAQLWGIGRVGGGGGHWGE